MEEIKVTPIVTPEKQLRVVEIKEGSFVVERKFQSGWKYLDSDGYPAGDASVYNIFKIKKTYSSLEEATKAMESFLVFPRVVLESSDTCKLKTQLASELEKICNERKQLTFLHDHEILQGIVENLKSQVEKYNFIAKKIGIIYRGQLKFIREYPNENLDNPI